MRTGRRLLSGLEQKVVKDPGPVVQEITRSVQLSSPVTERAAHAVINPWPSGLRALVRLTVL